MDDFDDSEIFDNEEIEEELSIVNTGEKTLKFSEEKISSPIMTIYEKN